MKVFELLTDESVFSRKNYALDKNSLYTNPRVNEKTGICNAIKFDIVGALMHCYPENKVFNLKFDIFKTYIQKHYINSKIYNSWVRFNDLEKFDVIINVLKELDI